MKTAVVIMNLGGPDSLEAIEPFLFNLFSDPDIFKILIGQKLFAKIISTRRAPKVAEEYKLIGGKSPINEWTEIQRQLLENRLKEFDQQVSVFTTMRYWNPLTSETIKKLKREKFDKIILLPLYPQYSVSTTGSSFNEWDRWFSADGEKVIRINSFHINPKYISAINERIDQTILKFPEKVRNEIQLVFSAHGTPVSMVKKGDPYSHQISETVSKIMEGRDFSHTHHLCYQSKVGPVKWLTPATDTMIEDLAASGKRNLLIIPISFVSDHVETSFELDIEYRYVADENNIENYIVMEGLNDSKLFIDALFDETLKAIEMN
jgi:ferrochelatase